MNNRLIQLFLFSLFIFPVCAQAQSLTEIEAAYAANTKRDWPEAIRLFTELKSKNPYNPQYAVRLAFALQYAGKYAESVDAFKDALKAGPWPDIYWYQIAVSNAKMNDTENAVAALKNSVAKGWPDYQRLEHDKNFESIRTHPEFLKMLGKTLPDNATRTERWLADFSFLDSKLKLLHFNLYNRHSPETWNRLEQEIRKGIPHWSDNKIICALMKYAALAGEGHTKVIPPKEGNNSFHAIPVVLYDFTDGIYILNTIPEYGEYVGKKVTAIGGVSVRELFDKSYPYAGHENDFHHKKFSMRFLTMAELLKDMGANVSAAEIPLTIETSPARATTIKIKTNTLKEAEDIPKEKWVAMNVGSVNDLPFYLQKPDDDFYFIPDTLNSLMYLKIKYIVNQDKLRFSEFTDSVFSLIDRKGLKRLVLDLRDCGGGNSNLNQHVLNHILKRPALNTSDNFFTVIGRNTYSAAINLANDLEYRTNTTFIGEPTGSSPNYIGESNVLRLPYSQLYLIISNRYHQGGANNSLDKRPWIAPHIFIEPASADYRSNADPVMKFIYKTWK
ncbi:MAG: hypothetical protein KIT62_10750 [Cyclobacteriaceae bacterium]|nr:hypothetical protein [Cyclobacteriaceae bacterium]